ncbi:MAG: ATP-binding protein [Dehalococcoidia bacterium]|nr:ATP-binding protein [Dehalococcoidia bacterium]
MEDFEKLGVFYIGREYDLAARESGGRLVLYDSRDLTTHGVCVGMTGSGKTGLCIGILEEAAIDGIPAIIIDPKGDMPNMMLTFPQLNAEDFAPWINEDDARRKGLSPQDFAAKQAELWKKGLASWGESGERISRLKQAADFVIYTPGSNAGIPVSILKSFAAPPPAMIEDNELLGDRIASTVTSLLGLIGIAADPIKSKEHILISTILDMAWRQGVDLDLAALIHQIQTPPVSKIGVLGLDSFYPAKERFELAMLINNLLAAPGFSTWMEGEALDIGQILYTPSGKPRMSIFSIAHLSDAERMFFVSLLLNQVLAWMRQQPGTTSLRAMLYMDEIFGYFPPVANPPSKQPLLTLLKQARAFGVGILLATQNPVDLDYKGLSNTGTWLIGRLQTERDKARVLEGLEGAAATQGSKFNKQAMEQTLAGLGSRVFLMNNVHDDAPTIFETRWAMSYLRGPLTRNQIKKLMTPVKSQMPRQATPIHTQGTAATGAFAAAPQVMGAPSAHSSADAPAPAGMTSRPVLPPDVQQYFVPPRGSQPAGYSLFYKPAVLGAAQINFSDTKTGVDTQDENMAVTDITDEPIPVNWDNARDAAFDIADLEKSPLSPSQFVPLPSAAGKARSYTTWSNAYVTWLYGNKKFDLFKSATYKQFSKLGESERDFRIRLAQSVREQRDEMMDKLRKKYQVKIATLDERVRKAQQAVDREAEQKKQQTMQTVISVGSTLLGAFLGSKVLGTGTVGRATTAARSAQRIFKEGQDVERAKETVAAHQQTLDEIEKEFKAETDELAAKTDPATEELQTISIRPAKKDIIVKFVGLAWMPHWRSPDGTLTAAWQ